MKVGILTFSDADNYGAMCQAYALQKYLDYQSFECDIIRYYNHSIWLQYHYCSLRESDFIHCIKRNIEVLSQSQRRKAFRKFRNIISFSELCDSTTVKKVFSNYDAIVVGSDQVWNPRNTDGDTVFLLDVMGDYKKIAYAASFGNTSFFDEFCADTSTLLEDFSAISVREKSGKNFLKERYGIDSKLVLDPVLLLEKKDWETFSTGEKREQYVFVYQLKPDKAFAREARKFAKEKGLKIYILPYLARCLLENIGRGTSLQYSIGPEEFVSFISNAEYVLTDSFHGIALSIAMNKQFFVRMDSKKNNTNERITGLMNELGISDREFENHLSPNLDTTIDYEKVNTILGELRKTSKDFLRNAFGDL
ncbi:polysaccharide pyruvyl transferase family protein [Butyrivibrio sp. X503]|uniref:polysaccharide pyruvyl transferase family protein n=1 Tax=Butyrivibrio sp. X503 TaxID=2364878 RepID=UPI001313E228|nr:polysaccharide pyruvyl transferase family protein [Butyrivibrio sp. X503]